MSPGWYTRASCEYVLLFTRGKVASALIKDHSVPQAAGHSLLEHSRKPRLFLKRLRRLFGPEAKVLEMFARTKDPLVDAVFGNQLDMFTA